MKHDLISMALLYAMGALLIWTCVNARIEDRIAKAAGRASWSAAWLLVSAQWLEAAWTGARPGLDFSWAAVAAMCVGWASITQGRRGARRRWGSAIAVVAGVGAWREGVGLAVLLTVACLFGASISAAIASQKWLGWRLAVYWLSFLTTFAGLLPLAASLSTKSPRLLSVDQGAWMALAPALGGMLLAVAGTHAFVHAGGTPEPLDPPVQVCSSGIYGRIRHPLQLAEILCVTSGALLIGTAPAFLFSLFFAALLIGPVRIWEEGRLHHRFGRTYDTYRNQVPAYLPSLRVNASPPGSKGRTSRLPVLPR